MLYDNMMDMECILLCDALNSIPGIETFESCCGHGTSSFRIWFKLKDHSKYNSLIVVARVFDLRYGGLIGWNCVLDNNDTPEFCPCFLISSNGIMGERSYRESIIIADNIVSHLYNVKFREIFNII